MLFVNLFPGAVWFGYGWVVEDGEGSGGEAFPEHLPYFTATVMASALLPLPTAVSNLRPKIRHTILSACSILWPQIIASRGRILTRFELFKEDLRLYPDHQVGPVVVLLCIVHMLYFN